jgi:hypothetical protein
MPRRKLHRKSKRSPISAEDYGRASWTPRIASAWSGIPSRAIAHSTGHTERLRRGRSLHRRGPERQPLPSCVGLWCTGGSHAAFAPPALVVAMKP